MKGLIIKGVGSFYTVLTDSGERVVCKARGKLRREGLTPAVGDIAAFEAGHGHDSPCISELLPRRNLLVRPPVANLDKLMIVLALSSPKPDLLLADKLLIQCALSGITPVIVLNKCDEGEEGEEAIRRQYRPTGYRVISASALNGDGLDSVRGEIAGCTCCFAGQSAVGKSSILNALIPGLALETGGITRKTERGRHTTRHVELFQAYGGYVLDTPGFSLLEASTVAPDDLAALYPEMNKAAKLCRFARCMHVSEPDCAVKPLVESGSIAPERYARYKLILDELIDRRRHIYD